MSGRSLGLGRGNTGWVPSTRVLELVHMDLMGPMQVKSIVGKRYVYVCVDDFFRFNWVNFLRRKSKAFEAFEE